MERLYGLVFAAKRMVKGAATLTSFALGLFLRKTAKTRKVAAPIRSGFGHFH